MDDIIKKKVSQSVGSIFFKGLLAGFFIAIASMLSIVVSSSINNYSISKILSALVFPIGLILVVLFKTELFTGNCLVIMPILNKEVKIKDSLKLLIVSYLGNFVGAIFTVLLISSTNHFMINDYLIGNATIKTALNKINLSALNAFTLGILCNILVCSAVYLASTSKSYVEKVLSCIFPVFAFVALGFEHSIANMYYLFAGLSAERNILTSSISLSGIFNNLLFVTLGNILGGFIIGILLNKIHKE